jgi:hypothetical protein
VFEEYLASTDPPAQIARSSCSSTVLSVRFGLLSSPQGRAGHYMPSSSAMGCHSAFNEAGDALGVPEREGPVRPRRCKRFWR